MNNRLASSDMEFIRCEIKARFIRKEIIKLYGDSDDPDKKAVADYLKHNSITVFPYTFFNKYKTKDYPVQKDPESGLLYFNWKGSRMFLRRGYTSYRASRYIKNIHMEQDPASPHRYTTDSFAPDEGSVIFDIGAAEGFFPLEYIERAKHIYIFECASSWNEALNLTYKGYEDKITIINKFVSDKCDDMHITLDSLCSEDSLFNEKIFIKADAEGDELKIINGAKELLNRADNVKLAICTYHHQGDEQAIREQFAGWRAESSNGYMLYYYDFDFRSPFLRKGVLRLTK